MNHLVSLWLRHGAGPAPDVGVQVLPLVLVQSVRQRAHRGHDTRRLPRQHAALVTQNPRFVLGRNHQPQLIRPRN